MTRTELEALHSSAVWLHFDCTVILQPFCIHIAVKHPLAALLSCKLSSRVAARFWVYTHLFLAWILHAVSRLRRVNERGDNSISKRSKRLAVLHENARSMTFSWKGVTKSPKQLICSFKTVKSFCREEFIVHTFPADSNCDETQQHSSCYTICLRWMTACMCLKFHSIELVVDQH